MLAAGDVDAVLVGRVARRRRDVGRGLRERRAGFCQGDGAME
jgi:hypothetical protein